jgi:hypothetical protein
MENEMSVKFLEKLSESTDSRIVLLRIPDVVDWLLGNTSFLPPIDKKNKTKDDEKYKVLEDEWGQNMLKIRRPDLKKHGQWTTKLGEHITEEFCMLFGKNPTCPAAKNGYKPDTEVEDAIWEAKAQTYFTSGTAGEKILGVPFKYADVPELFGKPLKILCIGRAEQISKESYGNIIGPKTTEKKRKFIEFYREMGIEWIGASELIQKYANGEVL